MSSGIKVSCFSLCFPGNKVGSLMEGHSCVFLCAGLCSACIMFAFVSVDGGKETAFDKGKKKDRENETIKTPKNKGRF